MKTEDVKRLVETMRDLKVGAFELGELKVSFHPSAFLPPAPDAEALLEAKARREEKATETNPDEDPDLDPDSDLMWSA